MFSGLTLKTSWYDNRCMDHIHHILRHMSSQDYAFLFMKDLTSVMLETHIELLLLKLSNAEKIVPQPWNVIDISYHM